MISKFKRKDIELEFMLTGEENEETIMFVHGVGANLRQFCEQHVYFSNGYRVLSVSLRGHGNSSLPSIQAENQYSLEQNRDDLLSLLEYLNLRGVHYVGNSAGGVIGYYLIKSRPDLFKSLVTFGTTAELNHPTFLVSLIAGIDRLMLRVNPQGYLKFMSKSVSKNECVQMQIYDLFVKSVAAIPHLRANLGNYSCLDIIKKTNVPYLLIKGESDKEINRSLKSTLQAIAQNDGASIVELASAGHLANLDCPDEFNKTVETFVKRHC